MKSNLGFIYNHEFFQWLNYSLTGVYDKELKKNKYYYYPPLTEKKENRFKREVEITAFGKLVDAFLNINTIPDLHNKYTGFNFHKKPIGFSLNTTYPGLLVGAGYLHEVGENKDEFQLGFFFDHTTGLPVIPASSVKGVLRYACEMKDEKQSYLNEIIKGLAEENKESQMFRECDLALKKEAQNLEEVDVTKFVEIVFEGKKDKTDKDKEDKKSKEGISIYNRDIFLDAFPVKVKNTLFGNDYITHHEHPLKNPNPVQFLRVQPEVTYQFQFILHDSNGISAALKLEIFRQIILDLGLGAKTNVGYGQFTP